MPELLLLSNSTAPGRGFLEHALEAIRETLDGRRRLLFIPFASSGPDAYTEVMRRALAPLAVTVESAREAELPGAIEACEAVFVGGGNSFRLLRSLSRSDALDALRSAVAAGVPYLGASAGSNLACPTIRTTNDMPIVEPGSFSALGLVPFQINPHYVDSAPADHQGETRSQRIEEFLEHNDVPVLGMREGSWLRVSGDTAVLSGTSGSRLFRRHADPEELPVGTDVSWLLATSPRFDVA